MSIDQSNEPCSCSYRSKLRWEGGGKEEERKGIIIDDAFSFPSFLCGSVPTSPLAIFPSVSSNLGRGFPSHSALPITPSQTNGRSYIVPFVRACTLTASTICDRVLCGFASSNSDYDALDWAF